MGFLVVGEMRKGVCNTPLQEGWSTLTPPSPLIKGDKDIKSIEQENGLYGGAV
jgi:hypothetical protein